MVSRALSQRDNGEERVGTDITGLVAFFLLELALLLRYVRLELALGLLRRQRGGCPGTGQLGPEWERAEGRTAACTHELSMFPCTAPQQEPPGVNCLFDHIGEENGCSAGPQCCQI